VRTYIGLAIGMGKVVCTLDPAAAAMRDAGMLAQMAAGGSPLPPPPIPAFPEGCIQKGTPSAGELFPQPWAQVDGVTVRLDDQMGPGPWLIRKDRLSEGPQAPFAKALGAWLEARKVEAVMVRPDRYVFGSGDPETLERAYQDAVRMRSVAA
jgi:3-(3-hydroxy-phenyl)propionate hydroxylase